MRLGERVKEAEHLAAEREERAEHLDRQGFRSGSAFMESLDADMNFDTGSSF